MATMTSGRGGCRTARRRAVSSFVVAAWLGGSLAAGEIAFIASPVTTTADGATDVVVTDLDGDGDRDLVVTSANDDTLAWFENNGSMRPSFTEHVITSALNGASSVAVGDLDHDGDLDIIAASAGDDRVSWWESDGLAPPGFTERVVTTLQSRPVSVVAADVNHDGHLDVLVASSDDNTIAWHRNDGQSPPSFSRRIISNSTFGALFVRAADIDGDGDLDPVSASTFGVNKIAWFENGGGDTPAFTERIITLAASGANSVDTADLNGDGRMDVVSSSGFDDTVRAYLNDGQTPPGFEIRVIATDADFVRRVFTADLDCDGDVDLLSASSSDDTIAWYENPGGIDPVFQPHVISTSAAGATAVATGDLDRDGTIDVVSAAGLGDSVTWYENQSLPDVPTCPGDFSGDGRVDFKDLADLLAGWGGCPIETCCPFDLTGDLLVNALDLADLIGRWGACPEPGACCFDQQCVELYPSDCAAMGGVFQGSGVRCGQRPCQPAPAPPDALGPHHPGNRKAARGARRPGGRAHR